MDIVWNRRKNVSDSEILKVISKQEFVDKHRERFRGKVCLLTGDYYYAGRYVETHTVVGKIFNILAICDRERTGKIELLFIVDTFDNADSIEINTSDYKGGLQVSVFNSGKNTATPSFVVGKSINYIVSNYSEFDKEYLLHSGPKEVGVVPNIGGLLTEYTILSLLHKWISIFHETDGGYIDETMLKLQHLRIANNKNNVDCTLVVTGKSYLGDEMTVEFDLSSNSHLGIACLSEPSYAGGFADGSFWLKLYDETDTEDLTTTNEEYKENYFVESDKPNSGVEKTRLLGLMSELRYLLSDKRLIHTDRQASVQDSTIKAFSEMTNKLLKQNRLEKYATLAPYFNWKLGVYYIPERDYVVNRKLRKTVFIFLSEAEETGTQENAQWVMLVEKNCKAEPMEASGTYIKLYTVNK